MLIKRSKIDLFFTLIGGKIYFYWLLPTNPTTHNPLLKVLYKKTPKNLWLWDIKGRIKFSYWLGSVHLLLGLIGPTFSWINILVNIYPVLVQLWILDRCLRIKKLRSL